MLRLMWKFRCKVNPRYWKRMLGRIQVGVVFRPYSLHSKFRWKKIKEVTLQRILRSLPCSSLQSRRCCAFASLKLPSQLPVTSSAQLSYPPYVHPSHLGNGSAESFLPCQKNHDHFSQRYNIFLQLSIIQKARIIPFTSKYHLASLFSCFQITPNHCQRLNYLPWIIVNWVLNYLDCMFLGYSNTSYSTLQGNKNLVWCFSSYLNT